MGTRLLVIGGDAAGMAAASVARRRRPDMEIVAVERGGWTSYSACGIPYLVGGSVDSVDALVARRPDQFRAMRIDMRVEHEVKSIDLDARTAEVHNLAHGRTYSLGFDLLHLATGSSPMRPAVPGIDAPHVHGVQTLNDAQRLLDDIKSRRPEHVVVVGGGYIGLELAEAFVSRGASVTIIDAAPEVMHTLDPDMGALVGRALRATGVTLRLGEALLGVEDGEVVTSQGTIPADLVVLGTGVRPNSDLAQAAGVALGVNDAVVVDRQQRTSVEGVWAAGDCCQSIHRISGRPVHQALGTVANKQGRVAGLTISGSYATFPGVVGTAVTRLCDIEIGRTGLSVTEATVAGFDVVSAKIETTTNSSYLPSARPVTVKMVAEARTGRLLGVQIVGGPGAAKRVDVVAVAAGEGMDAEDLLMADLGYAPPFSSVWDPLQVAARQIVAQLSA
ncbi:FAD-dependent oxidoreductase [Acidiferrimicrobium sp. IK]|uniref:FAD-dependent oxidoreductase n=1 Tax=Acidiferrimicrobium sp. IK TaxID=2871700 RepID=UPI0021CB49C8|nr:FAD-dependent oxidoreductase [Acidiferrimicrobium sp. IK]MCU4186913.1 FAD-dependent oxidoreductase [Acidiferrimicrobium sp. IK]